MINSAIKVAIESGVPMKTIELLLLLPGVTALIAIARHIIGVRGFGIFLPAALSIVFVETGPIIGISIFLIIVAISTFIRLTLRRFKIKLQYLPRMSLLMFFVSVGILLILLTIPYIQFSDMKLVSIFPVLILILLSEDFTRVQLGKSVKIAVNLTLETLGLALAAYFFMTITYIRSFIVFYPEVYLLIIFLINILVGKYLGLRLSEYVRFRSLLKKK